MIKNDRNRLFIILMCLTALLPACGRKAGRGEKVATVNDAPIFLKDFEREVSLSSHRDPSRKITPKILDSMLDTMVDRKLMIQEAVKKGLAEDERFVETIKTFWEQTLIRELIAAKTGEWADRLAVTDGEVKRHYERMGHSLTVRIAMASSEAKAEAAKARMLKGENPDGTETIGRLLLENVQPDEPLYNTFDLSTGDAAVFKGAEGYLAVMVVKREPAGRPPLKKIYDEIKRELLERKRQKALSDWLDTVRKSARIEVDRDALNKVSPRHD
ncbi:MAG: SurA N-terminal domain-containing protein [Deltaproteobacteria bacterium]|nr:SurA N-terminal domain-containing protein [Deltaproteobacteria bacterium]